MRIFKGIKIGLILGVVIGILISSGIIYALNIYWVAPAKLEVIDITTTSTIQTNTPYLKVYSDYECNYEITKLEWDKVCKNHHAKANMYVKNTLAQTIKVEVKAIDVDDFAFADCRPYSEQKSVIEWIGNGLQLDSGETGWFTVDLTIKSDAVLGVKNFYIKVYELEVN